ncbi:MAG TPA: hypothetical protein VG929_06995 [Actinomycetota bacterium]|nr:hypothetical protein [Actinomycetota bacterium]
MSPTADEQPFLAGNRIWFSIAIGVAVAIASAIVIVWWEQRSLDQECDRLDRRVVTNQEEADQLFDDKAAAGCLDRD